MRKTMLRVLLPVGLAATVIGVGAGAASAATPTTTAAPVAVNAATPLDQVPTLISEWQTWNKGGADLGRGAAELISSAWLGAPQSILDLGKEAAGMPLIYGGL